MPVRWNVVCVKIIVVGVQQNISLTSSFVSIFQTFSPFME
jgi:hypothetical protein